MTKSEMTQGAVIKSCTCKHEFQDKRYGQGKRVFNKKADKSSSGYKCTVCGSEK